MHKNTLNLFLKELNIKHTNSYSSSVFTTDYYSIFYR